MKVCSKCKIEKDLSKFKKNLKYKDNLFCWCKKCIKNYNKKWKENNPEYQNEYQKENYNSEYIKQWREKNKNKVAGYNRKYYKSKANYDTFAPQISYAGEVKNIDGFLQTKCTYCGKWYYPTVQSVHHRIQALNGITNSKGTENHLYCSNECKEACPIYWKQLYQEGHPLKKENTSREVQPELRQMVFERDEYTCLKCGKHQDNLDVPLHCHHIEGILWEPIESADIDICITVCKICHNEIHQEDGCGYNDMKCKGEKNEAI